MYLWLILMVTLIWLLWVDWFVIGFETSNRGCCGTGLIEVGVTCNSNTTVTFPDMSKYVFWDSVHSTEKTYDLTAQMVLDKYIPQLLWGRDFSKICSAFKYSVVGCLWILKLRKDVISVSLSFALIWCRYIYYICRQQFLL